MQLWSLCTSEGAGVYFEPYCGSHTQIHDAGLGQGPNVVLDLLGKANLAPGSKVFFDNLFTSFPLLEKLSGVYSTLLVSHRSRKSLINNLFFNISELGIAGTGTVRQNRLNKIPIIDKKEMEKKTVERGTMEAIFKDDQVLYLSIEFCFCILIFFILVRSSARGRTARPCTWHRTSTVWRTLPKSAGSAGSREKSCR